MSISPRISEYPTQNHFLLHFSDTHLLAGDAKLYGSVDADLRLKEVFDGVRASGAKPDAMIFTGDIVDLGEPEAYDKIRVMVDELAKENGSQVIWAMGNHDVRENFYSKLLDEKPSNAPVDRVYDVNGLRVITLDTTVPGHHYGEITSEQLVWLANELETPAPHGTILALHHPPVPCVSPLAITVELIDQKNLAEVIEGTDIISIIGGHLHYSCSSTFAGIPVSVASSTCYTQDLNVEVGGTYGRDGAQTFNMIHVYNGSVLHSVVPSGQGKLAGKFVSEQETQEILKEQNITIPDS